MRLLRRLFGEADTCARPPTPVTDTDSPAAMPTAHEPTGSSLDCEIAFGSVRGRVRLDFGCSRAGAESSQRKVTPFDRLLRMVCRTYSSTAWVCLARQTARSDYRRSARLCVPLSGGFRPALGSAGVREASSTNEWGQLVSAHCERHS